MIDKRAMPAAIAIRLRTQLIRRPNGAFYDQRCTLRRTRNLVTKERAMTKKHEGYLLLVEDSLDQREAMQAALEIEGYHVIAVPGGQEALDHLRGAGPPPRASG